MPEYCDVALPVPLDMAFTYRLPPGGEPAPGTRVIVPFRQQRLVGIVTALHDRAPSVQAKTAFESLDEVPALSAELLQLGKWISEYYLAPIGEVFRSMLPLGAEFRRAVVYRITDEGQMALHLAGEAGSSARTKKTPEEQDAEYRVLNYLSLRDQAREETLRSATGVSKPLLEGMVRKKWIAREDASHTAEAARTRKVALLKDGSWGDSRPRPFDATGDSSKNWSPDPPVRVNPNQRLIIETLSAAGGRLAVEDLRALDVPKSTLTTLAKRGLVELVDEP